MDTLVHSFDTVQVRDMEKLVRRNTFRRTVGDMDRNYSPRLRR